MKHKGYSGFLFTGVALVLFIQCSPMRVHRTLSIFFDGVPDSTQAVRKPVQNHLSAAVSITNDSAVLSGKAELKFKLHKPYQEHQCEQCHDAVNIGRLKKPQPDLCYSCHDNYTEKYAFVHGPVSSGHCLACHNPHLSENRKLLTRSEDRICSYCHRSEQVLENKVHQQAASVTDCLHCHHAHGGKDHYMVN